MIRIVFLVAVISTAASAEIRGQTGYGFSGSDVALNGKVVRAIGVDVVGSPRKEIVALSKIVFMGLVSQTEVLVKDLDGVVPTAVITVANSSYGDRTTLDAADLDQDGDQDIVVSDGVLFSNTVPRSVFVLKNTAGVFAATSYPVMFGRIPALADFDSDGDIDISLGSAILVNDGSAAFPTSAPLTLPVNARETIAGDFDGDGDVDIAYTLVESAPIPTSFAEVA